MTTKTQPPCWKDSYGDRFETRVPDSDEPGIAAIYITHRGVEHAIYVDESNARQLIAWLRERLSDTPT
jgi:hypothetical protein